VNNVVYNKYAESARVEWVDKYSTYIDPAHAKAWRELCSPRGAGLILKSIKTDYKFVRYLRGTIGRRAVLTSSSR